MPTYDIGAERERFEFELTTKVIGRKIEAVQVTRQYIEINLSEGSAIRFSVRGDGLMVTVPGPKECPTLDTGVVQ